MKNSDVVSTLGQFMDALLWGHGCSVDTTTRNFCFFTFVESVISVERPKVTLHSCWHVIKCETTRVINLQNTAISQNVDEGLSYKAAILQNYCYPTTLRLQNYTKVL